MNLDNNAVVLVAQGCAFRGLVESENTGCAMDAMSDRGADVEDVKHEEIANRGGVQEGGS